MSDQAKETDEVIETPEELEITETPEASEAEVETQPESDEVEIVLDGEEQPSSKPRKSGFYKRLSRLAGQRDAAKEESSAYKSRAEALEEENKLYRMKLQQLAEKPQKAPKPEDFETDSEYNEAKLAYDQNRINELVDQKVSERLERSESQNTQSQQSEAMKAKIREHSERADRLNVADYDETEDNAIESLGDDLARTIMTTMDKSEMLLYYLGKNPVKAEELRQMALINPVACVASIGGLQEKLKLKPRHSTPAPDPDSGIGGGAPGSDYAPPKGATFE